MTEDAQQLYKRALLEMRKQRWPAAIKFLNGNLAVAQKNWRFPWNLGWCYFKLGKFNEARKHMIRAAGLAPENATCKWGLGITYLETKHFKKAEVVLAESLRIKESHLTRISLAFAYLAQGKIAEAEKIHLQGIRLQPENGERYDSYAAFLSDVGRETEARRMSIKAKQLSRGKFSRNL
jgi:Flp pilus assembly protein TadD